MLASVSLFAAPAGTSGPRAFLRRLYVARLYGRRRLRSFRSRRTDPDFDEVGIAITTIDDDDSSRINSALADEVIHRAPAQLVGLSGPAGAARVDHYVSL